MKCEWGLWVLTGLALGGASQAQEWVSISSQFVRIVAPESTKALQVAGVIEQLDGLVGIGGRRVPVTIVVADGKSYSFFSRTRAGRLSFFVATNLRHYVVLGPDASKQEVLHEYAHYWIRERLGESPPWFDEGLAVVLSTLEGTRGTYRVSGKSRYDKSERCANTVDLERLFSEKSPSHDRTLGADFYRTAGRLMNLVTEMKGTVSLEDVLEFGRRVRSLSEAAGYLGVAPDMLGKLLKSRCSQNISLRSNKSGRHPLESVAWSEPERIQVEWLLAELAVRMPLEAEAGLKAYRKVLDKSGSDARALEGIGIGLTVLGKFDEAMAYFWRARPIVGHSDTWSFYAGHACRRAHDCRINAAETPEKALEAGETEEDSGVLRETSDQWGCSEPCKSVAVLRPRFVHLESSVKSSLTNS